MAAAHNDPTEIDKVDDQHDRHDGGDADQGDGDPIGCALGRGIGGFVFHVREDARDA